MNNEIKDVNSSEKEIKRKVIQDLIINNLYFALGLNNNHILEFDKYNLDNKTMTYLLKEYDVDKFNELEKMLNSNRKENI